VRTTRTHGAKYDPNGDFFNSGRISKDDHLIAGDLAAMIPGASPESAVDIGTLTETAKAVMEGGLAPLWVRGEVSDFKRHRNGHWYFSLRDVGAQIRCVVWSRDQRKIPAAPDDGMEVLAYGQLTVYPVRGDLHLTITRMEARGDGLWRKALEETRLRLERDGLLAPERKRRLPFVPQCVAVVTSPDGAAIRDIIAVISRRSPGVQIVVSPAKVQGEGAAEEICAAIQRICLWGGADVMIVGRGGGAREDLWAFNDERVARAIAAAPIPVISAVGHEIDISIADLVADLRAATPSAAAEAAVPVRDELVALLRNQKDALKGALQRCVSDAKYALECAARNSRSAALRDVQRRRAAIALVSGRLNALSPLATLARGYAVAQDPSSGRTLSTVSDFAAEHTFKLLLRDGSIMAKPVTP
jgi:exodeoxyribonuclease VII large subunit